MLFPDENQRQNLIIFPKRSKRKKMKKPKITRRYMLLPPRMLNYPKSINPPQMIHYHYLSGFGRPMRLNEAPQPSFHAGDGGDDRGNDDSFRRSLSTQTRSIAETETTPYTPPSTAGTLLRFYNTTPSRSLPSSLQTEQETLSERDIQPLYTADRSVINPDIIRNIQQFYSP